MRRRPLPATGRYLLIAAGLLLVPWAIRSSAGGEHVQRVERTLDATGLPLKVVSRASDVVVAAGEAGRVRVVGELRYAGSRSWEEEVQRSFDIELAAHPGHVEVRPRELDQQREWGLLGLLSGERPPHASLDLRIEVPAGTAVEVENRYGDVTVSELGAPVVVDNASGAVRVAGAAGSVRVTNRYGDLELARIAGTIEVENLSGRLQVRAVSGGGRVVNRYGDVRLTEVGGPLAVEVKSGNIEGSDLGGSVELKASYGHARLERIGGPLRLRLVSGQVHVTDLQGAAEIHNDYGGVEVGRASGDVNVDGKSTSVTLAEIGGGSRIQTSYGAIALHGVLGPIEIKSSSGSVEVADAGAGASIEVSYAPVTIHGVAGPIAVSSLSGDVVADGLHGAALTAQHRIEARYGDVSLAWPGGVGEPTVTLAARDGSLASELAGVESQEGRWQYLRSPASAAGGAGIELRADSGSVTLRRVP